ncbi:MAG: YoaP domain-containing protein [Candidatus Cloacimonetes bacterium]|nr:YoaP domain-containing protein [Candidatus Cloacimonadota bacterium]
MSEITIIDTTMDNILNFGVCGYKNIKRDGYPQKLSWLKDRFQEGLILKILYTEKNGAQGMIEYIPGEFCWRPVDAIGYMFIHCIFSGFKKIYRGKGYGKLLLNECLEDAKKQDMFGVAIVTRKSSFMVGNELFLKNGFEIVDKTPPDFNLLVKKFVKNAESPKFKGNWEDKLKKYSDGLFILRADQCPYTVKNVKEISEIAEKDFRIIPQIIDLKSYKKAQNTPCAFGTFCIIYDKKIISYHPISKRRFSNIMNKILN